MENKNTWLFSYPPKLYHPIALIKANGKNNQLHGCFGFRKFD